MVELHLPADILALKSKRIAVKLRPSAEKLIRKEQHPWIFDESILKQNKEGNAGDLAVVFDQRKNEFLACGLIDPSSPIRIKLLKFFTATAIDQNWFNEKVAEAKARRHKDFLETTNAYRLIFGENDGLPGLIADVYHQIIVLKIYSEIWLPHLPMLLNSIIEQVECKAIVIRLGRNIRKNTNAKGLYDGDVVFGELVNDEIEIIEHAVKFLVNVVKGHKTGFFLDHRHNRLEVQNLSEGADVLDVFSYAGGFSTHALKGGASSVTSVDISEHALQLATQNVKLNKLEHAHQILCGDAFEILNELIEQKKKYGLVIIDPPSFAKRRSEINRAMDAYRKLAKLGSQLLKQGGTLLLASCSSRVAADEFFAINEKALLSTRLRLFKKTFHDIDHPINFKEGAYLKTGYYR